jgi:hypothetical protein
VSRIRKKTFYLQFCIGTPEGHQKSIFNTPKAELRRIFKKQKSEKSEFYFSKSEKSEKNKKSEKSEKK